MEAWQLGKAVATEATFTPEPARARLATATRLGYTHTAATGGTSGSAGSGRRALEHSASTLPGVSAPSRVVRSIIDTARRRAATLDCFLMLRFARLAARSSAPPWSTAARASSEPSTPSGNRPTEPSPSRTGVVAMPASRTGTTVTDDCSDLALPTFRRRQAALHDGRVRRRCLLWRTRD